MTRYCLTAFQRKHLEKKLTENLPKLLRQRIEIMLLADTGKSQAEICQIVGCCPATARHWITYARSQMAHQWWDNPPGRPKKVTDDYIDRLQALIVQSPRAHGYMFQRWTADWLRKHLAKELGIEISLRHFKRLLKDLNLSTKTAGKDMPPNPKHQAMLRIHDLARGTDRPPVMASPDSVDLQPDLAEPFISAREARHSAIPSLI